MSRTRTSMIALAAGLVGLGIGVAGIAHAATTTTTPSPPNAWERGSGHMQVGRQHIGGRFGPDVTGANADKAKAAALAAVPGTVERVQAAGDGYVVHVIKADGSEVHVHLDAAFKVTGQDAGRGRRPGDGMHRGGGWFGTPATGAAAARAKAAALAAVPGTVERVDAVADGYVVHVMKADGSEVHVHLDAAFKVTGQDAGRGWGGHHHGDGPPAGNDTTNASIDA